MWRRLDESQGAVVLEYRSILKSCTNAGEMCAEMGAQVSDSCIYSLSKWEGGETGGGV